MGRTSTISGPPGEGRHTPVSQVQQVQTRAQVTPKPRAAVKPTATPPQGTPVPKRVRREIMGILRDVENIRGLDASKPVNVRFISREDFARRTKVENRKYWTVSERDAEEKTLVAFGFTSARTNFRKLIAQDTGDSVLGFYDPKTKRLFVVGDESDMDGQARSTMAHELAHALQDQNHNCAGLRTVVRRTRTGRWPRDPCLRATLCWPSRSFRASTRSRRRRCRRRRLRPS